MLCFYIETMFNISLIILLSKININRNGRGVFYSGINLETMARDIHSLIEKYKGEPKIQGLETFRMLKRLFPGQCEITEGGEGGPEPPVQVKVKEPGDVPSSPLQNPPDPDATCSGHKGQGSHLQIMETCPETRSEDGERSASLITLISLERAHEHDGGALLPATGVAGDNGLKPETLLADTVCGSDEYVGQARPRGGDPPRRRE
jgi:hypothetical protein